MAKRSRALATRSSSLKALQFYISTFPSPFIFLAPASFPPFDSVLYFHLLAYIRAPRRRALTHQAVRKNRGKRRIRLPSGTSTKASSNFFRPPHLTQKNENTTGRITSLLLLRFSIRLFSRVLSFSLCEQHTSTSANERESISIAQPNGRRLSRVTSLRRLSDLLPCTRTVRKGRERE